MKHFVDLARSTATVALACAIGLAPTAVSAQEQVTLKMWALVNENYPEYIELAAAEFKKTHPNVNIVLESTPNEAYKTAIQVALTGSEPPDVFFNWSGEDAARLARDGLALDITELGNAEGGFQGLLTDSWKQSFVVDGRNYGVPTEAVTKYFYYDKPFFEEHDLKVPASFEELLGLCKAIRAIDPAMVPLPLGNSERWKLNHYITVLNERVLGIEATAADYALTAPEDQLFTNPGYIEAWQKVLDLQEADCFQDAPNATSPEASRAMFSTGASPMIFCGSWCMATFDGEGYTDYSLFRFPPITGAASDGSTNMVIPQGLQVSAKTKHPEEAVAWASFLVTPEMGAKYAEMRGSIPSNAEMIDSIEATEQFKWVANDVGALSASFNVLDVMLNASVANAYLDEGVEVLNGTKTPEQAMEAIRAVALEEKAKAGV
ncbi:MAG TPA: ABC transporter substrate-binding protein [Ramlibacter sp.]|jgi:raffinose/stachyose/melibiose transport system substrate-binding protein